MKEKNDYYIYAYLDTRKGSFVKNGLTFEHEPFYIGKGRKNRLYAHKREVSNSLKCNIISKIKKETGNYPKITKLKDGLTEKEAFELERYYIDSIGKRILGEGPLSNIKDGGKKSGLPGGEISPFIWN